MKPVRMPSKPGVWDIQNLPLLLKLPIVKRLGMFSMSILMLLLKPSRHTAPDATIQARLQAACRKESGAWLHTLPIASLGLCMDDKVVRVAMGLRLGTTLCYPHECHLCGARVDSRGTHGLHCRKSLGQHPCHMVIMTSSRGPWLQPRSRHTWNQQGYADQMGRDQTGNCNAMEEQMSPCLGSHLPGHLCPIPLAAGHPRGKCSGRPS